MCARSGRNLLGIRLLYCLVSIVLGPSAVSEGADSSPSKRIKLNGDWEFYPHQLIEYHDPGKVADGVLAVGTGWTGKQFGQSAPLERKSFATFRKTFKDLPQTGQIAYLFMPPVSSASRILIYKSGSAIPYITLENGRVATTAADEIPGNRTFIVPLGNPLPEQLTIYLQVSNFFGGSPGINQSPLILFGETSVRRAEFIAYQDLIVMGITLAVGIYLFMMWFRYKKDLAPLFLSLVCLGAIVRNLTINIIAQDFLPNSLYWLNLRLEYATMAFGSGFGVQFIQRTFPLSKPWPFICNSYTVLMTLFFASTFFFPIPTMMDLRGLYQLAALSPFLFYFVNIVPSVWRRREGALLCGFGCTLVMFAIFHDILLYQEVITGVALYPTSFAVFLIILSQLVAMKAARSHVESVRFSKEIHRLNDELKLEIEKENRLNFQLEEANANLEQKVLERTAEISSMLEHIPQGILTVDSKGQIGPKYSAHLPVILNTDSIAGKSFYELILKQCQISDDQRDLIYQSLLSSIGESALGYELNSAHFPAEITLGRDQPMVLKCTWNPELGYDQSVKSILVTLLDVTEEVRSKAMLEMRNEEFDVIRQLVGVESTKASKFFASSHDLLKESVNLINKGELDLDAIKILFINLHTLKGAARTFQFRGLAEAFHKVESTYAEIIKANRAIDAKALAVEIQEASHIFDAYLDINSRVLGRHMFVDEVVVGKDFLEQNLGILTRLIGYKELPEDYRSVVRDNREKIVKLIFSSMSTVLSDVAESAKRIAKDLGKCEPIVEYRESEVYITQKQEVLLRNVFIHLVRNALDHGIESAVLRKERNKSDRGLIKIHASKTKDRIRITVADDGGGLAIGKIRAKALMRGIAADNAAPQEVAQMIFLDGLSTAQSLTMISGRGVGMDAVKKMLERESGTVEVLVEERLFEEDERYSFQIVMTLPIEVTWPEATLTQVA